MRRGITLVELVMVCTFLALLAGLTVPRIGAVLDAVRLDQAAHEVAGALTLARATAIGRGAFVHVVIDEAAGAVRVESGGDTLRTRALRTLHRVSLRASRDTITYAPTGMGHGVANSTIVVGIGARAETVTVSRLGRMRRSW